MFGEDWHPAAKGDMRSLRVGQYHYIENGDHSQELYDLKADPSEQHNLADSEEGRPFVEKLEVYMDKLFIPK